MNDASDPSTPSHSFTPKTRTSLKQGDPLTVEKTGQLYTVTVDNVDHTSILADSESI
jgi:hypothetical protein